MAKPLLFSERIVASSYTGEEAKFYTNDTLVTGNEYEFTPDGIGQWIYKDFLNNLASTTSLTGIERIIIQKGGVPVRTTIQSFWDNAPFYTVGEINDLLDEKADTTSPVFTGNPQAPTPTAGDNDTSIATTAFVQTELADYALLTDLDDYVLDTELTTALNDYVQGVTGSGDITVDNTDPQNPIISYTAISGGDVVGPASAVNNRIVTFNGTTGKLIKDSGSVVGDFATAAQGTLAGTAVQPARTISAGTGLTGGGDLSANRSLALSAGSIASLALADSALQAAAIGVTVQGYDVDTAKVDVAQSWSLPQRSIVTALTSGTTITMNVANSNDFSLTLGHNATLANPTNQSSYVGLKGSIACVNDGTGGYTLAYGANWFPIGAATAPAIPTGANAKFRIDFHIVSSTRIDFKVSSVGV